MMHSIYEIEQQFNKVNAEFSNIKTYVTEAVGNKELHEFEKELFRQLLQLGRSLLEQFIEQTGTGYKAGDPPRSETGNPLRYKGIEKSPYISIFGEIQIARAAYADKEGRYFYPLNTQLNLPERKYSYLLQKWLKARSVESDYHEAVEVFNDIFGLSLFPAVPQRLAPNIAALVDSFYEQFPPPDPQSEGSHLAIGADGKGIRLLKSEREKSSCQQPAKARRGRGEKSGIKKESVVTVDFSFHPGQRDPEEIVKALMNEYSDQERHQAKIERQQLGKSGRFPPRMALNKHYRATLSGKNKAMKYLMNRIQKRDSTLQKPIIVLIDGDPALERSLKRALRTHRFSKRVDAFILDIIHVSEYVWEVATALYGENDEQRIPCVREILLSILEGKVSKVIKTFKEMRQDTQLSLSKKRKLKKAITYFENHKHMMKYGDYLAKGYPISTGLVEGACGSLVKDRMEQSGMRWTIKGAQAILDLKAARKNNDWEQFWEFYVNTEGKRLYTNSYKIAG
jgi:hypothetical protein